MIEKIKNYWKEIKKKCFEKRPIILKGILLLVPAILYVCWYISEYKKMSFEEKDASAIEGGYKTPKELREFIQNRSIEYDLKKDEFPEKIPYQESSEYTNFTKAVSESFVDKLGIFSLLPIHRVCLKNNNIIYLENNPTNELFDVAGAIGIKPEEQSGYDFFTKIGQSSDCKNVYKDKFINTSYRTEVGNVLIIDIGLEDKRNLLEGKNYRLYINSFRVDTTDSRLILKLNFWRTFPLFYLISLWAWSYLFFQGLKILDYLHDTNKS